jgi:predicted RNase H-like HicB family nuclease
MSSYRVNAEWDGEAKVWVASSDDVPGLATGADTLEEAIMRSGTAPPTDDVS